MPSNSGDKDQENHSSKPVQANSSREPILGKKKKITEKGWWSGSRCRPRVQTQYRKKKKKKKKNNYLLSNSHLLYM
jgi:hypothetical protein